MFYNLKFIISTRCKGKDFISKDDEFNYGNRQEVSKSNGRNSCKPNS